MMKFLTAAIAAVTLLGVAAPAAPAAAAGAGAGQYYQHDRYGHDRYGHRYDRHRSYNRHRNYNRNYRGYNRSSAWSRHVSRCQRAYYSYNPRTDMYRTRYGGWRRCRL